MICCQVLLQKLCTALEPFLQDKGTTKMYGEGGSLREKEEAQLVLGLMEKNKCPTGSQWASCEKKAEALVTW